MREKIRIIGIGSPLGADRIGWEVVQHLEKSQKLSAHRQQLSMICCDRPGMRLVDMMKPYDTVLLIDAVNAQSPIGSIHCFDKDQIDCADLYLSSHGFAVAEAVAMAEALGVLPTSLRFYGIEIGALSTQLNWPPALTAAVLKLAATIEHSLLKPL